MYSSFRDSNTPGTQTAQTVIPVEVFRPCALREKLHQHTISRLIRLLFCAEDCGIDLARRIARRACWRARPAIADFPSHTRNAGCISDQREIVSARREN